MRRNYITPESRIIASQVKGSLLNSSGGSASLSFGKPIDSGYTQGTHFTVESRAHMGNMMKENTISGFGD